MLNLLSMANKPAGSLTDADLESAAKIIAGGRSDNQSGLVSFFKILRDAEPDAKVTELLSTPSANSLLQQVSQQLQQATDDKEGGVFCRCPNCQFPFILPD